MRDDLDKELVTSFPNLYRDRQASIRETAMCWGFECGDGWFNLLWELSRNLEDAIGSNPNMADFRATQVKQKFGGLRFYVSKYNDSIQGYIDDAERLSYRICEQCGEPGKPNERGWIVTLCDSCRLLDVSESLQEHMKGFESRMNKNEYGNPLRQYEYAIARLSSLVQALTTIGFNADVVATRDYAGHDTLNLIHDIAVERRGYVEGWAAAQEERLEHNKLAEISQNRDESIDALAKYICAKIVKDLNGRSGLENAWDEIDPETRQEIEDAWKKNHTGGCGMNENDVRMLRQIAYVMSQTVAASVRLEAMKTLNAERMRKEMKKEDGKS